MINNKMAISKFDDINENKYKRAGLILVNKGKFIIVYGKNSKKWSFPKGQRIDEHELSLKCALREFEEETGIFLTPDEQQNIKFFFRTSHCIYYICHIDYELNFQKYRKNNVEISKVASASKDELLKMDNLNYDLRLFCQKII